MPITTKKLLTLITASLEDMKAENIITMDIRKLTDIADHMVVATGNSTIHAKALADDVYKQLKKHGADKIRIEGEDTKDWLIIDAFDVIVHIMLPTVRDFYNLEELWTINPPKRARIKPTTAKKTISAATNKAITKTNTISHY